MMLRFTTTGYIKTQQDVIQKLNDSLKGAHENVWRLENNLGDIRAKFSSNSVALTRIKSLHTKAISDVALLQGDINRAREQIAKLKEENEKLHLGFEYYYNLWKVSQDLLAKEDEKRERARKAKYDGSGGKTVQPHPSSAGRKARAATGKSVAPRATVSARKSTKRTAHR